MVGKLNFQEALDWGMTRVTDKEQGKQIGVPGMETKNVIPVDRVKDDARKSDCWGCFEEYERGNCPAYGRIVAKPITSKE